MKRGLKQEGEGAERRKDLGGLRCLWTEAEDKMLLEMARKCSAKHWEYVAQAVAAVSGGSVSKKTAKQCRERWHNHLNPDIKAAPMSPEEEATLFQLHRETGNKWSDISHQMSGRTDNAVKNYFFCRLRKMIRYVKNGVLAPELLDTLQHAQHTAYLLGHLYKYYVCEERSQNVLKFITPYVRRRKNLGDKYIIDVIQEAHITADKFHHYIHKFLAALPADWQHDVAHDCAHLHPTDSAPEPAASLGTETLPTPASLPKLPLLPRKKAFSSSTPFDPTAVGQSCDSSKGRDEPCLDCPVPFKCQLSLPLPPTLFSPVSPPSEDWKPTFLFTPYAPPLFFQSPLTTGNPLLHVS